MATGITTFSLGDSSDDVYDIILNLPRIKIIELTRNSDSAEIMAMQLVDNDVKQMYEEDLAYYLYRKQNLEIVRAEHINEGEENVPQLSEISKVAEELKLWIDTANQLKDELSEDVSEALECVLNKMKYREYESRYSSILYNIYLHRDDELYIDMYIANIPSEPSFERSKQTNNIVDQYRYIYEKHNIYESIDETILIAIGYLFILHMDTNGKDKYIGFKSAVDRNRYICRTEISSESIHEKINLKRPFNPFLEIDCPAISYEEKSRVLPKIHNIIRAFEKVVKCPAVYASSNIHREGKISYHVFPTDISITVENNDIELLNVINQVKEIINDDEAAEWIDLAFTKGNSHYLRLPWFVKTDRKTRFGGEIPKSHLIPTGQRESWAVQHISGEWNKIQVKQCTSSISLDSDVTQFLSELTTLYPHYNNDPKISGDFIYITRNKPFECKSIGCKNYHYHRGLVIWKDTERIYAKCERSSKSEVLYSSALTTVSTAMLDSTDTITKDAIIVNTNRLSTVVANNGNDIYVKSAYGTGKSWMLKEWAVEWKAKGKLVLFVSCRKSLSCQASNYTGFSHYINDVKTDTIDTKLYPQLIIQIDSLARITETSPFDVIIIDEVTALLGHSFGANDRARCGLSQLREYIKTCGQLVLLDNDLNTEQVQTFKELRNGHSCSIYKNIYSPWTEIKPIIYTGHQSPGLVRTLLFNEIRKQYLLQKSGLESYSRIVVPCHSKTLAQSIAKQIEKEFGDIYNLYTADTDDEIKTKHFSDATTYWHQKLVVIYSPTISVGTSCNESAMVDIPVNNDFGHCFAFFDNRNIPATTSIQMLTRCRTVKNIILSVKIQPMNGKPIDATSLINWACTAKNNKVLPNQFRHDRSCGIYLPTATDPLAFYNTFSKCFEAKCWVNVTLNLYRSQSNPVRRICSTMLEAGFQQPIIQKATPIDAEIVKTYKNLKVEVEEDRAEVVLNNVAEGKKLQTTYDGRSPLTQAQKLGMEGSYLADKYGVQISEITSPEWFTHYKKYETKESNFQRMVRNAGKYINESEYAVTSHAEAGSITEGVAKVLNIDLNAEGEDLVKKRNQTIVSRHAQFVLDSDIMSNNTHKLLSYVSKHSKRVYDNIARIKSLNSIEERVSVINIALNYVGAGLSKVTSQRVQNSKEGCKYVLVWGKYTGEIPSPIPKHVIYVDPPVEYDIVKKDWYDTLLGC